MARNNIKTMRKKNTTYSQSEVAEKLGISKDFYSSFEQGRREPKMSMLKAIAKLFKCSIDELI